MQDRTRNTGHIVACNSLCRAHDVGLDNIGVNLDVLGPRVRGLHAKDGLYPTDPYRLGQEVAIGRGKVRLPEVIAKLHELHYSGPITVEREISGPKEEVGILASRDYLQRLIDREYRQAVSYFLPLRNSLLVSFPSLLLGSGVILADVDAREALDQR